MELRAEHFHHPYSPYDIQLQFMQALYGCLEEGKIAVFESPTGKPARREHPCHDILLHASLTQLSS